jgi:hypothetical protein
MNEQSEILTQNLEDMCKEGKEINIFKQIALCALDIICGKSLIRNVLFYDFIKFVFVFKKVQWVKT